MTIWTCVVLSSDSDNCVTLCYYPDSDGCVAVCVILS